MSFSRIRILQALLLFTIIFSADNLLGQEENMRDSIQLDGFKIKPNPKTNLNFGGAMWLRGVSIPYNQKANANKDGLYFDQFRLAFDGDYGIDDKTKLTFSTQIRFWYYQTLVHHMWVGLDINDNHEIELGVTQVPFGTLPGSTNSFWYSAGYYVGLEDDHDSGIKYHFTKNGWDFHLAYFLNSEYNDATVLNRFAPDLVRAGDQQNEERNQTNIRLAKTLQHGKKSTSEFGVSGEIGQIRNRTTGDDGSRWKGAVHYVGNYGKWSPKLQAARYEYDPKNPEGVDDNLVYMGFFEDARLVASKATLLNASIKRDFDFDWWLFNDMYVYFDYSLVLKDEALFADTELFNPGIVFQAGPLYIWYDFLWGKNSWWFNDSQAASGPGQGAVNPGKHEYRQNLSIEWFF